MILNLFSKSMENMEVTKKCLPPTKLSIEVEGENYIYTNHLEHEKVSTETAADPREEENVLTPSTTHSMSASIPSLEVCCFHVMLR